MVVTSSKGILEVCNVKWVRSSSKLGVFFIVVISGLLKVILSWEKSIDLVIDNFINFMKLRAKYKLKWYDCRTISGFLVFIKLA